MIGQAGATQRIMSREALENGRITHASQDGSREFISLLACINATGAALPPSLIYKGESTLQDTWLEDWLSKDIAHFAVSSNGWSCNALGLHWLETIFHRYTSQRVARGRRLLIVDGHSSHVNLRFIDLCDKLRILVLVLPPHSTHRLQPLDVSLFAPLASYYTKGLNELMMNSLAMVSMSKRAFWSVFWPAWQKAFTPANIASGFEKTGIWPYNPVMTLEKITKPTPTEVPSIAKTPMTCRAVRRVQRQYYNQPNSPLLKKLFRANERLASQHSVDQHIVKGLTISLRNEKKKRQRGKRLNLLGEEDSGPQFFSPKRVQAARQFQAIKDAEEVLRQQQILDKKALAATRKAQKEEDKLHRAILASKRRQLAAEASAQKAIEKQAQKELREAAKHDSAGRSSLNQQSTKLQKAQKTVKKQAKGPGNAIVALQVEEVISATSCGRKVQRPRRFHI